MKQLALIALPPKAIDVRAIDIAGQTFGFLSVVRPHGRINGSLFWECLCECGKTKLVTGGNLRAGNVKSCGCKRPEMTSSGNLKHGHQTKNSATRAVHRLWYHMIRRCHSPDDTSYARYGAIGIRVCDRWRFGDGLASGFDLFLLDMGGRPSSAHSIDRIDNNCGYEPGNCRWATAFQQARNKRNSKLTAENVIEIRDRVSRSESKTKLACEFGVSLGMIKSIAKRRVWHGEMP